MPNPTCRRLPFWLACLILTGLSACHPFVLTMDGAESDGTGVPPRLALARITTPRGPVTQMELRTADGVVRAGTLGLLPPDQAVASPGGPIPLAARDYTQVMAGQIGAPGIPPLDCRFGVLNPARGFDGGGKGGCRGPDGKRVDFIF